LESNRKFPRDLSTSSPQELSGIAGRLFIEGGVVVIRNEESARLYKSSPLRRITGYREK
jgi:hypothetical protein